MARKVVNLKDLINIIPNLYGKKVLVGGCFDILHIGHIRYLKSAKKEGDILIVALESDQFIKVRKKKKPFHNQKERAEILASLEFVDLVILLPFMDKFRSYSSLVDKIKPNVIAISAGDPQSKNKARHAKKIGANLTVVTKYIPNKASSLINCN